MSGDELEVLLIEDNPGDVRLIEEFLREPVGATAQEGSNGARSAPSLRHADSLTAGLELLDDRDVDVVLLDLGLPESQGLETLETVLERAAHTPIVVLTGLKDESVGLQAVEQGAQEYLVKDELTSVLLQRSIRYAIERQNRERRLAHQHEQLAALNNLNAVVRDINEALVRESRHDDIEQLVCDRLVASDSYLFAWVGALDHNSKEITVRAKAGVGSYLDDVTITADDSETATGPTGRAIRTQEMQVAQDIKTNPDYEHWRERALEYGFESSAAIPIAHDGLMYGVLNVYAERPHAFEGQEYEVIRQLGEIVGHATAALDRKVALMSDDVTEVRFQVEKMLQQQGVSEIPDGSITIDRVIPIGGDSYLAYGVVDEAVVDSFRNLVEQISHFESLKIINEGIGSVQFELNLERPPIISTLAAQGSYVKEATIESGDLNLVVHLPPSAEVRRVSEAVREAYPDAEVVAQRQTTRRDRSAQQVQTAVSEDLTERQRAVLETAYLAGFFNWPRDSSGEEVAESLGVSAPTFHQHVRIGLSKLLGALFSDAPEDERDR
ncbi:bacterio-opsin activator domain-containing protein [Haloprofundus sp. MHR1]|uniref:bacterio-opsin activator domain-containing protein n=1 Tax=Haloprofundus sp. MHR1 TaxID=2572921 RepID=UPI0010BEEA90|nr:bacterio-opsin activator domain-containing protein [Haloprofundus sp. MHR1]QCJ47863.1 response regulator [Haloprofundus sp. MHR1]